MRKPIFRREGGWGEGRSLGVAQWPLTRALRAGALRAPPSPSRLSLTHKLPGDDEPKGHDLKPLDTAPDYDGPGLAI